MGQRQLLCLARVMLEHPKLLVMDEATSSLDRATDERIQRLLRDRSGDTDTSGQPASCSAGTTAAATCGGVGGEMRCGAIQSVTNGTPRVRLSDYPQGRIEIWKEDGQGGGSWGARRPNLPPRPH